MYYIKSHGNCRTERFGGFRVLFASEIPDIVLLVYTGDELKKREQAFDFTDENDIML